MAVLIDIKTLVALGVLVLTHLVWVALFSVRMVASSFRRREVRPADVAIDAPPSPAVVDDREALAAEMEARLQNRRRAAVQSMAASRRTAKSRLFRPSTRASEAHR